MSRRTGWALAMLLMTGLGGTLANAQEAAPTAAAPSGLAQATAGSWELSVTPYLWATALKGDVGIGRTEANVDASFSDILDNLNGALMLEAELRKGRFGLISDTIWAQLEDNAATTEDRLKIDATANMLIQSLAGTYRVGTWQLAATGAGPLAVTVDPYAGIRYTYLSPELRGRLDLPLLGVDCLGPRSSSASPRRCRSSPPSSAAGTGQSSAAISRRRLGPAPKSASCHVPIR
jgi:hypothetical protein